MKICVIGGGGWGKNHINTLNKLGVLHGIVDSDKNTLDQFKNINEHCLFFESIDLSLTANFDGYIIATPAETHYSIAKKLILNSKNILIEKPVCLNSDESENLIRLAKENKVFIMGGHLLLFHPAFIKMKEMINSGALGNILYMYSNRLNFGKIRSHENVLWSLAPHDISLFLFFAESLVKSTNYSGSSLFGNGIDDSSVSTIKFINDITGHIFVSWYHPFKEHKFVLVCEKGMLVFEDSSIDKKIILYNKYAKGDGVDLELIDNVSKDINYESGLPLDNQLEYFINSLGDKNKDLENMKLSSNVVKILEQLK